MIFILNRLTKKSKYGMMDFKKECYGKGNTIGSTQRRLPNR